MLLLAPIGEDATVDGGMQRLDPAPEHFGSAGEVGHLDVIDAGLTQGCRRAAARDQFPPQVRETAGQVDQPGFVIHRQQCPHGATSDGDPVPSSAFAASSSMKRRIVAG